jgi:hypothetical protein
MQFKIISGKYTTQLNRTTPSEAARDAINLWKLKKNKPNLAAITTVIGPNNKTTYLSTTTLVD